jgi:hypothetical protein
MLGVGEFDAWSCMSCHWWSPEDIYALRLRVQNGTPTSIDDAKLYVRAGGVAQNMRLDVRGLAMWKAAGMGTNETMVDVVYSVSEGSMAMPGISDSADDMAKKVVAEQQLRARFPSMVIASAEFGILKGDIKDPGSAAQNWLAQPIMWDHKFTSDAGPGGPTDSFATPSPRNIVIGQADVVAEQHTWTSSDVFKGGTTTPGSTTTPEGTVTPPDSTVLWVVGLGVVGFVGYQMMTSRGRARRAA